MSEFLKQFQAVAFVLSPMVLAGIGFALIWLGLCLWLGGLKWLKFLAGIAGAGMGYAGAIYVVGPQAIALIVSAVIVGMVCLFFDKLTVVIAGAVLAAIVVNLIFSMSIFTDVKTWNDAPAPAVVKDSAPSVAESLTTLETYGVYFVRKVRQVIQEQGSVGYTASAIAGLVLLGIGFVMPRGVCALTCAVLGVAAVAAGLFLLLLYKGSKPIDYVLERQTLFWAVALAMIGFGMLADLALCPNRSKSKASSKNKQAGDMK